MTKITEKKLSDYTQDSKNFNKGNEYGESLIEKSVGKFGAGRSMLVSDDGVLIAGNKSHQKLAEAGIKNVIEVETDGRTAVVVKRTDIKSGTKQFHELALADNATSKANLVFDEVLIEETLTEEVMLEWGVGSPKAEEDDYQAPPLDEIKTDIVLGDLFEITDGKLTHHLLCGDSTKSEEVKSVLSGNSPNLMITDPPYGVEYNADWRNHALRIDGSPNDGRAIGKVENDDISSWIEAYKLSPSKIVYCWHASASASASAIQFAQDLLATNFEIRAQIIWAKNNIVIGRGAYHWQHEPCWYAVKKGNNASWIGDRKQSTIWNIDKPQKSETGHSTQKPVECMARPIRNHSGDVYDPFGGSGTTMVASHQLNRNCYMIEIMPSYCQIIIDRMLKLDSSLSITKNGEKYVPHETEVENV